MPRLKNHMDVLIVSGKEEMRQRLKGLLADNGFQIQGIAENGEKARRLLGSCRYDLVIIDSPLPFESGAELALDIAEGHLSAVIFTVNAERLDETRYRVEDSGVIVLPKPLQPEQLEMALHLCLSSAARISALERENEKLRKKIEELRLVNRAKWVLCEKFNMDESSAHRYIEKKAMDNRVTRLSVAKQILKDF